MLSSAPRRRRRPPRWLRPALRLPNALYRLGLGRLLGERFLLLTHTGRRTGRHHETTLEVLRHERGTDTYVVCSGWGPEADWLRNIAQHPDVVITTGRGSRPARAQLLPIEPGARELAAYARRHPIAFRTLGRWVLGLPLTGRPDFRELAWSMPVVALRSPPRGHPAIRLRPDANGRARPGIWDTAEGR
jgi:deazaflavin-dependent oxidoreductase (nitroreductase family)